MKEGREKLKESTASVEEVTDKTGQFIPSTCLGDRMQMLEDTVLEPALTNGSTVALYLLFVPRRVVDGSHGCCWLFRGGAQNWKVQLAHLYLPLTPSHFS